MIPLDNCGENPDETTPSASVWGEGELAVNTAAGVAVYSSRPDLVVWNPYGPDVSYQRFYDSSMPGVGLASPGLSSGWTDGFDVKLQLTGSFSYPTGWTVTWPNGATDTLSLDSRLSGAFGLTGGETDYWNPPAGAPYSLRHMYNAIEGEEASLYFSDQSHWEFQALSGAGNVYRLTRIVDATGHSVYFNRDAAKGYRITSITGDGNTLLTFNYHPTTGRLTSLTDMYSRKVLFTYGSVYDEKPPYSYATNALVSASQVMNVSSNWAPAREWYTYSVNTSHQPYLHGISTKQPPEMTVTKTKTINYFAEGPVASYIDAEGKKHAYTYNYQRQQDSARGGMYVKGTRVQVFNSDGTLNHEDIRFYEETTYRAAYVLDGGSPTTTWLYDDSGANPSPRYPVTVMDDVGQVMSYTWDRFGNMKTSTDPCGTTTYRTYQYGNLESGLSKLGRVSEKYQIPAGGTREDIATYTYLASGLVQTKTVPSPAGSATTTFTYNTYGSPKTTQGPGPDGITILLVTSSYTSDVDEDGTPFTTTEKKGQAVHTTFTENGVITLDAHTRYDARGNVSQEWDQSGYSATHTFDLMDDEMGVPAPSPTGTIQPLTVVPCGPCDAKMKYKCRHYCWASGRESWKCTRVPFPGQPGLCPLDCHCYRPWRGFGFTIGITGGGITISR